MYDKDDIKNGVKRVNEDRKIYSKLLESFAFYGTFCSLNT